MDQATMSLFGGTAGKAGDLTGSASRLTAAFQDPNAGGEELRDIREHFRALLAEHLPEVAKAGGKDGKDLPVELLLGPDADLPLELLLGPDADLPLELPLGPDADLPLELPLGPDMEAVADDILTVLNALQSSFPAELGIAPGSVLEVPRNPDTLLRDLRAWADQRVSGGADDPSRLIMDRLASLDPGRDGLGLRVQALDAVMEQVGRTDSRVGAGLHAADRGGIGGRADNPQQLAAMLSMTAPTGDRAPLSQLPAIESSLGSSNWNQAISQRITMMIGRGIERAEVKIHPPNLGPLEIRIGVNQEHTSLVLASQNADTRDALEQALPRLRELLEENGIELADTEVRDQSPDAEDQPPPQADFPADAAGDTDPMQGSPGQWRAADVRILDQYI